MIKYAKIINYETGLCTIGEGTNIEFYISIGMKPLDVQQSDIDNNWYLFDLCPMKSEEEKAAEQQAEIDKLNMTRGDFFEGLILAQSKDEDDVLALVDTLDLDETTKKVYKNRVKNALDFYRSYPLVDVLGERLGLTKEQMDMFFKTKNYNYLKPVEEVVNE